MNKLSRQFLLSLTVLLISCYYKNKTQYNENAQVVLHSAYDDSTLNSTMLPMLLPYNRIIDPAGMVIKYGDGNYENHALDVKQIPGTEFLAIEDRYGIAIINTKDHKVIDRWSFDNDPKYKGLMSTYSGIEVAEINNETQIFWSAANGGKTSYVMRARWDGIKISILGNIPFKPEGDAPLALPNEVSVTHEGSADYLYVVLNGNNRLVKVNLGSQKTEWSVTTGVTPYGLKILNNKAYVSNWGGTMPIDTMNRETAGVPYGKAYVNPKTGAIDQGSVSVFNLQTGFLIKEIKTGLHPNDIAGSADQKYLYVSNGNSDDITVIDAVKDKVIETIPVQLFVKNKELIGDSPNALTLSNDDKTLFATNGLDNAVAVIKLGTHAGGSRNGNSKVAGFIPTGAYPGGIAIVGNKMYVTNLEGEGARVNSTSLKTIKNSDIPETRGGAYNSHHQLATLSIIPVPDEQTLDNYTKKVEDLNLVFRSRIAALLPRKNVQPKPVPDRIGEPSVFKHVIYIIKENRTYDQVMGDVKTGDGREDLCIFGNKITPNQHQLAKDFLLMDNYHVSGKSSAEGHQWTDAAMVTDYVEKNVRAWFRSYPHVQTDAMVYDKQGFIWNNAADHGKTVRIYGEACIPEFKPGTTWTDIYNDYKAGRPFQFKNVTTISRVRPMLSQTYPGYDNHEVNDQLRASAFIKELEGYEKQTGDNLPQLLVMALPNDHTGGTRPGLPTPRAMVADNDLALGRIVEAVSKSKFWANTVIFVTEDDSQAGWDHVSAYRTTGFVFSPYSRLQQTVHTNYNQTCIVRTIEQILGIPPMNTIDATALPMYNCFTNKPENFIYKAVPNQIELNEMNAKLSALKGKDLLYAKASLRKEFDHIDGGNDDLMNKIIWHSVRSKKPYPVKFAGKDADED